MREAAADMCLTGAADLESEETCEESRLSSSCGSCLRRSLRTGLAEHAGDESVLFGTLLNQTTDHDGKFGDLCSRPG